MKWLLVCATALAGCGGRDFVEDFLDAVQPAASQMLVRGTLPGGSEMGPQVDSSAGCGPTVRPGGQLAITIAFAAGADVVQIGFGGTRYLRVTGSTSPINVSVGSGLKVSGSTTLPCLLQGIQGTTTGRVAERSFSVVP